LWERFHDYFYDEKKLFTQEYSRAQIFLEVPLCSREKYFLKMQRFSFRRFLTKASTI
jgi:hypothetical protein